VVSTYPVITISSLLISATADITVMNCQLKAVTIHAAAWVIANDCCLSHFGSDIFLYVNSYVECVK